MKSAILAGALFAIPALAGPVGYAQATNYFKKDARPTLYQPLNLLDARDVTAWCSAGADPLNEVVTFGFKGSTRIEELKITTGNNFDEHTFQEFSRAKKLILKGPAGAQTFTVSDQRGPQTITFNPPLEGARFTLEVLDLYPAEDPDQPVCLTDVVFVSEGKPLNGSWMTTKLKYDKNMAPLLGTWFAGYDGTPDKYLSFFFDGTYRYSFEPYDSTRAKEKVIEGTFDVTPNKLTLEVGGKKVGSKYGRSPAKKGEGQTLSIDGEVGEDLKQVFRSHP